MVLVQRGRSKNERQLALDRQAHERQLEQDKQNHAVRSERRKERLAAYEKLDTLVLRLSIQEDVDREAVAESVSAVQMRASDPVSTVARELLEVAIDASEANGDKLEEILKRLREKRRQFQAAVREEDRGKDSRRVEPR